MVVTLVAFIVGSVLGALHRPLWEDTVPSAGPVSLDLGAGIAWRSVDGIGPDGTPHATATWHR